MHPRRRAVATAAALATAATGVLGLPAAHADSPAASMAPTVLAADVVSGLASLEAHESHAPSDPSTPLVLGVSVADPDPAAIAAFDAAVSTPGSAEYRHFLTPSQFAERFGPTQATVDAVASWLTAGGLQVHTHAATPGYLTATGTVAQIGALVHTSFETFPASGLVANTTAPTVPAAVAGIAGLNTGTHPHLNVPKVAPRKDSPPTGLLSPQDLWDIYQQPANDEGQGQGLALFGYGTTVNDLGASANPVGVGAPAPQPGDTNVEADLRAFEHEYGLPEIPYYLTYFESAPGETLADDGGYVEWTLDAQAADGMAPAASKLVDYFAWTGTDPDVIGAYASWVDDPNGPLQGSTSFGGCEALPGDATYAPVTSTVTYLGNPNQGMYEQVFAQAVAEGRTLFSASGDTQACPTLPVALNGATPTPTQIQDYPGVSPDVVGVGGSVLYFSGGDNGGATDPKATRTLEYPWAYSGGGQSHFLTAGAYQAGALQPVNTLGTTTGAGTVPVDPFTNQVDYTGATHVPGAPARLQPDVAALSGDISGDGYTICSGAAGSPGTTCDSFGAGTSLSSPLWLGLWARAQAAAPSPQGLGFANPVIYRLAQDGRYLTDFYDLGSPGETPPSVPSTNGSQTTSPAEGGYDTQTGWGVPNLTSFIEDANGTYGTADPSTVPTDPTGGTPGVGPAGATDPTNPTPTLPEAPFALAVPVVGLLAARAVLRRRGRVRS